MMSEERCEFCGDGLGPDEGNGICEACAEVLGDQ